MYRNTFDGNNQKYNSNKKTAPEDNYYRSSHKNQGNNSNIQSNDYKFEQTKNKIKVILYKNGFILNNGPFRDKSIPENQQFMDEVEKGLIPQELIKKGIIDLGILLENRKNQIYTDEAVNPITAALSNYIYGGNNVKVNQNVKIHPPIYLKPGEEIDLNQFQINDPYILDQDYQLPKDLITKERNKIDILNNCHTPIDGRRSERRNIFFERNENNQNEHENYGLQKKESSSAPKKKEDTKFHTFASLLRREQEREEEEKKKKKMKKQQKPGEKQEEEKKEEEKKFIAFTGEGKLIGNVNTEGLQVNKNVKNVVDRYSPVCTINIRLFNGEVVKSEFNYTQTLRDIYYYVSNVSGSKNFHLLEGFPPKALREYKKTIQELHLENTTLTQKLEG